MPSNKKQKLSPEEKARRKKLSHSQIPVRKICRPAWNKALDEVVYSNLPYPVELKSSIHGYNLFNKQKNANIRGCVK